MKVLVTGGAGFIGSHVVDTLVERGDDVLVLDDYSSGRFGWVDVPVVEADIRSPEAFACVRDFRPDAVVHLAAQMSVKVSMRDPVLDAEVNVLGLLNVLEGALAGGCRRVVFASSGGTIYGDVPAADQPITERRARSPLSFYGLTKSVAVDYLELYRRERGLEHVALALGNVYGPRQNPHGEAGVVAIFARRLLDGLECTVNGDGATTRDYVHVTDVAQAFALATGRGQGLLNIGTGVATSVTDVYAATAAAVGTDAVPLHGPALAGEVRAVALDPGSAASELGWTATVGFEQGVRSVVDWLRSS